MMTMPIKMPTTLGSLAATAALAGGLTLGLATGASAQMSGSGDAMAQDGSMMAEGMAQTDMIGAEGATFRGDTVTFPTVMASNDGYLVIHAVENGEIVAPASVAHTAVSAGENSDVEVAIPGGPMAGSTYAAMLHAETNGNDSYDFGMGTTDVDTPVTMEGAPVVARFVVSPGG